jgi:FemAB-related protein (PEP-CTERM system-associated)
MSLVRILREEESISLPESLLPAIAFTGLDSWMFFTRKIYNFPIYRTLSRSNTEIDGWLALAHVKHPIFGNYLATSPFGSFGGFAFRSIETRDALLSDVCKLSDSLGIEYCVLRFLDDNNPPPSPWHQHPIYSTYLMDLPVNAEDLWGNFGTQHRKHTRQALRKGFKIQFGHLELLNDAYEVLAYSMHELGSPYHSKKYLYEMAASLEDKLEFAIVKDANDSLVGMAVLIYQGKTASNLHANILRDFRSDYAGEFLYWSLLEHYCQKGMTICDMGRSLIGSGNETFKMKWHPHRVPLAYWYYLPKSGPIPELNQKSTKFQLAIRVWKLLPAFAVRAMGPYLIRGIV